MKRVTGRLLSLLLALAMLMSIVPIAGAAETEGVTTEEALSDAIETVSPGGTVTLGGNIDLTEKLVLPENKTFTLALGAYNITQTADGVNAINLSAGDNVTVTGSGTITSNNNGVYVPSGATLTVDGAAIKATVYNGIYNEGTVIMKNGTLTGGTDGENYYNGIYTEGTLTVNDGTIHAIYVGSGSVSVGGGTIDEKGNGDSFPADGGTLTITAGTVEGWMSPALSTTISGGTFNGSVFANQVTGGTFNGSLILNGENPSISSATINNKFSW